MTGAALTDSAAVAAPPATACPGCGRDTEGQHLLSGHDRMLGVPGDFEVRRCADCRLAYTAPQLGPADFERFYPAERYPSFEELDGARRVLRRIDRARLDFTVRRGPYRELLSDGPGRLLDVGCGRGDLAATFKSYGWDVCGVEPSPAAAARAEAHGVQVHNGTFFDVPWPPAFFDAIVMNHSLEHIPQPRAALERARDLLRPGGLLGVSVPNFGCWEARRFGADWYQLDLPRHLQHFERETLTDLAQQAGLEPVALRTSSMRGALQGSLQYRLFGHSAIHGRWWRLAAWLSVPMVAAIGVVADGDCLNLVARRP